METIKLTKKDFNFNNEFIGKEETLSYNGNIEIEENLGCVKFKYLKIRGSILAEAGSGIEAGHGIKAGWGIEAGHGIKAGWGIEAGLFIKCRLGLSGLRIFAGLCIWKMPKENEKLIECGKLERGDICFGNLKEIGINEENERVSYKIDGVEYSESTLRSIIKKATSEN